MSDGMIEKVEVEVEPIEQIAWSWNETTPGEGVRPDYLHDKYNSVSEQAKAYTEAEKMMNKVNKAPDEYDLSDYSEHFNLDDSHFLDLKATAKKNNITQSSLKSIIDPIIKYQEASLPSIDDEIAKLGPGADSKLKILNTWASNTLSDSAMETLGKIGNRAEVIELFDELRMKTSTTQSTVPGNMQNISKQDVDTVESVQQEMNNNPKLYLNDPAFRQRIKDKLNRIHGED